MFFNEYDMLEGRLEYLYDTVDYFIIVENDVTHNGNKKPMNYASNIDRYRKYQRKIIYLPLSTDTSKYDWNRSPPIGTLDVTTYYASMAMDVDQRNYISQGLKHFKPTDVVMISDLDEIPNKQSIRQAVHQINNGVEAISFVQDMFYYNLKQKQVNPWTGTVITTNRAVAEKSPQWFRRKRWEFPTITNAGWHLSYWMSLEKIQHKILNFAHQEYNIPEFTDINKIAKRVRDGRDLYDRGGAYDFILVDRKSLNSEFLTVFEKYEPRDTDMMKTITDFKNAHLGCGGVIANNYINIDFLDVFFNQTLQSNAVYSIPDAGNNAYFLKHNLQLGIPIQSNQLDTVYHSHFLEHLNDQDGRHFIEECFRVLKSGGVMRFLVPDLELWSRNYINGNQEFFDHYRNMWLPDHDRYKTNGQIFMGALHNHEHKMGYDFETCKYILERTGFTSVVKVQYGVGNIPSIDRLEDPNPREFESLAIECIKP